MVDVVIEEMVGSDRVRSAAIAKRALEMGLAIFSARAKWRSSSSARESVRSTNLTKPTLLEMVQRREGINENGLTYGRLSGRKISCSPICQVFNDLPRLWFLAVSQKVS
jgi:hypothetical protein